MKGKVLTVFTACAFKNPGPRRRLWPARAVSKPSATSATDFPAGQLLEQVGAKEARIGGAAVYSGHGNFLYNTGEATARDVLALAAMLKKRVKDAFGIDLEEEVIYLPAVFGAP